MRRWYLALACLLAACTAEPETVAGDGAGGGAADGYVFEDPEELATATPPPEDTTDAGALEPLAPLDDVSPKDTPQDTLAETGGPEKIDERPRRPDANAERRRKCERRGGRFAKTGAGLFVCVEQARDGGKACKTAKDCRTGLCLARSNTCSPVAPLLGCHDLISPSGKASNICVE